MSCGFIAMAAALSPAVAQNWPGGAMSRQQALAVLQPLYAQSDQAFSEQNAGRIASSLDPSYVFVHTNGVRDPHNIYLTLDLANAFLAIRNINFKTTIKDVRVAGDSLIASIEWIESSERKQLQGPAWSFKLESATQEETWKRTAAGWKRVLTKTLTDDVFDPVPTNTLIDHDTQILSLVCGGPLSAEEKQRFAAVIRQQVQQDPNHWYKVDVITTGDLKSLQRNSPTISSEVWMKWRLAYGFDNVDDGLGRGST